MIQVFYVLVITWCVYNFISSGLNLTPRKLNTLCSELLYNKTLLPKKNPLFRKSFMVEPFHLFQLLLCTLPLKKKITNTFVFILYSHVCLPYLISSRQAVLAHPGSSSGFSEMEAPERRPVTGRGKAGWCLLYLSRVNLSSWTFMSH